jgi:hypothetical protein
MRLSYTKGAGVPRTKSPRIPNNLYNLGELSLEWKYNSLSLDKQTLVAVDLFRFPFFQS